MPRDITERAYDFARAIVDDIIPEVPYTSIGNKLSIALRTMLEQALASSWRAGYDAAEVERLSKAVRPF